jgi:hypothetical protein
VDKWDDFIKDENNILETYFLLSISRTKFSIGNRINGLFYISGDVDVLYYITLYYILNYIIFDLIYKAR